MIRYFIVAFSMGLLGGEQCLAQVMDTTYLNNSPYAYYVVQKNHSGENVSPIYFYDDQGRLGKTVSHRITVWRTYYDNPHISYRIFKRNGKNECINPVEFFDHNDNLVMTQIVKNEKIIRRTDYDTLGNQLQVLPYKRGKIHGTCYTYHPNGKVEWTKTYKKGKLHGERTLRDSTGNFFTGRHTYRFPNSDSFLVTNCINGRPHGRFEVRTSGNRLSYIGHYDRGYPHGEYTYFDKEGNITRIDIYKDGKFKESIDP